MDDICHWLDSQTWWRAETPKTLLDCAYAMTDGLMKPEAAEVVLKKIVDAMRMEYGE
jgi:hypothetical protein